MSLWPVAMKVTFKIRDMKRLNHANGQSFREPVLRFAVETATIQGLFECPASKSLTTACHPGGLLAIEVFFSTSLDPHAWMSPKILKNHHGIPSSFWGSATFLEPPMVPRKPLHSQPLPLPLHASSSVDLLRPWSFIVMPGRQHGIPAITPSSAQRRVFPAFCY